jgi:hypothetical protein
MHGDSVPWRPRGWVVAAPGILLAFWDARHGRSRAALPNLNCCPRIRPPAGYGVLAPVEKKIESEPQLERNLKSVLEVRTAGDPDEQDSLWTDLSPREIAQAVTELGTPVCPPVVRDWLDDQGLTLHKIAKVLEGGQSPDRNDQFLRIAQLKAQYTQAGNPVFSMDSKAKEHLGQLFRAGRVYTQRPFKAFDHDYPSWATGILIPHGIYDLARNRGHINIGLSHDTSEFACDSFRWYWNRIGKQCYPHATSILLLCDGGGSNSASHYIFKQDLQELVNDLGTPIRMAHYPSYCSKYNPIERRLFSQVSRACQGMLFDTMQTVVGLMRKASTTTGLKTTVNVMRGVYELKRKVADDFKAGMKLAFDTLLPTWNYVAEPQ